MDAGNKLVSVIMPVFNAQRYLKDSIQSVIRQTYNIWELIIVDDGSDDESLSLCQDFARNDRRIKVYSKENGGASSARNYGLSRAQGKFVTFIDDDDIYIPQFLEAAVEAFDNYNCDFFKCGREDIYCDAEGNISRNVIRSYPNFFYGNVLAFKKRYMLFRKSGIIAPVWNSMYRRGLILEHNILFDEQLKTGQEDISFNSRYCKYINGVVISDRVYYRHFIRAGFSTSTRFSMEQFDAKVYSINEEKDFLNHAYDKELDAIKMVECFEMAMESADKQGYDDAIKYMQNKGIIGEKNSKNFNFVSMTKLRKISYLLLSRKYYGLYYGLVRFIKTRR